MTSWAVDLVAYIDGNVCWEVNVYDDVADAIQSACKEIDTKGFRVRWGGAWSVSDLAKWDKSMEEAYLSYIDYKRKLKQRPFFDGPHFEVFKARASQLRRKEDQGQVIVDKKLGPNYKFPKF